ncbi:MAG: hypothetical protein CSA70_01760 [Rhodobacterales bacterium]|nr:MAG: hypothetical protein CSA70_01760 [Rhodobacterales bacterium]
MRKNQILSQRHPWELTWAKATTRKQAERPPRRTKDTAALIKTLTLATLMVAVASPAYASEYAAEKGAMTLAIGFHNVKPKSGHALLDATTFGLGILPMDIGTMNLDESLDPVVFGLSDVHSC